MTRERIQLMASVLVLTAAACSDSPTKPDDGPHIANFQARQLGLAHQVCNASFQYWVYDELTFDVLGVDSSTLVGTTLHEVGADGSLALVGKVAQCAATVTPCSTNTSVCLTAPGSGRIRVYTGVQWTPVRTWRTFLRTGSVDSNIVQADIARPDGLHTGSTASIAVIDARRTGPTVGEFTLTTYSPGVAGRRITLTREVWVNGARFSTFSSSFAEDRMGHRQTSGGILISADASEFVGLLEEHDANGNLIATDRKSVMFQ